ncbi:hypothetical protein DFP72DRAFT_819103 [Ephemerocybe angulata]|uniref:SWIM-type domain-containing protein n=1 Tax=Ephemerocybe angulata TaxID=980116 RepID=A0A8H6HMT8_9AGAR|nr:hypothetical protein DFP72DRAFT_819103 [Tulosesus angulatus]
MAPKRGAAILETDFSDEEYKDYPASLFDSAQNEKGPHSPTKALRQYQQPLVRKGGVKRAESSVGGDDVGGGQQGDGSSGSWEEDHGDAGNTPSWDSDTHSHGFTEEQLSVYHDAVDSFTAGFYFIEDTVFAVEGWNIKKEESTGQWYHLEYMREEGVVDVACTCPLALQNRVCVHQAFTKDLDVESYFDCLQSTSTHGASQICSSLPHAYSDAVICVRQQVPNSEEVDTMFSVKSRTQPGLKGRAIVTHKGTLPTAGIWRCSKSHSGAYRCTHIPEAKRALKELLGLTGEADTPEDTGSPVAKEVTLIAAHTATLSRHGAVSYRPILPPVSVMLPRDEVLYARPPPFRDAPTLPLPIDKHSTCACPQNARAMFNKDADIVTKNCRIYTLTNGVHSAKIQLQQCPTCPGKCRRHIGPDLRERGLFNYNNSVIVSHELLDDYTISYSTSETPFAAYVTVMEHRYATVNATFMGEDLFRTVWFAYISIQAFENDMGCSICGSAPETIIWDGVTVAFHKKHLSSTISPPTEKSSQSISRPLVKNLRGQQLITDATLRKQVRQVIKSFKVDSGRTSGDGDGLDQTAGEGEQEEDAFAEDDLVVDDITRIDTVYGKLNGLCPALGLLFLTAYGFDAYESKIRPSIVYRSFFLQIAAEESILQMVNPPSLTRLRDFIANPMESRLSTLLPIPGLYQLLKLHGNIPGLIPMMTWIADRASSVWHDITVDERPMPVILPNESMQADWRLTGCFYSLEQIRHRPDYPKLISDLKKEDSSRGGDTCGKFYSEYGEKSKMGGIMAGWCTHSVCYGFHCIPSSEGRNDVFSAMVTRWPVAPKRVIYDFACALGPYCLLREPEFFKNTLFAIDDFHATGHTKCSPAAFLYEYANADPRLISINSSAGECGNSALRRIRKSVSYMSQERAVIYTKTFLSVWNRFRIKNLKL